jgi:hypothetical protein
MLSLFKIQFNTISDPENRVTEGVVESLKNVQQVIGLCYITALHINVYMLDIRRKIIKYTCI